MTKRRVKPEHVRREEIMNAALDVIYEVGLSNTTIAQIAKKSRAVDRHCQPLFWRQTRVDKYLHARNVKCSAS